MSSQPADGTEFSNELTSPARALIGVAGLDTLNNAIHKNIWSALGGSPRPDRAPLHFKLFSSAHEFPIVKPKRNSYEWYIPKGILKKNWMNKHLNVIPAVIVVFYDMEWNDLQWNEKIIECASRVQSMRAATEGHSPRLVVVVVQSNSPLPSSEDALGLERAQALCVACEISSKSLFVLPHGDHLMGYIIRLENAFYDLAQNYYTHEARIVKSHRDHLIKNTHQYLFVRHQFKMGFINELKQDNSSAHKHYLLAYNNLLEIRVSDTNILEVKTVAGYINYKLCRLLFFLNLARDAVTQLRTHMDRYRSIIGPKELMFEHYAWMARQYSSFGELFEEAIRNGLTAIQTQHPGFYYQQAAQCATQRRQACHLSCSTVGSYPQPDPLQGTVEYYGQRVWRPGKLNIDPPDIQKELEAIAALQYTEYHNVNHSIIIISLLGSAITQFKTYHCPRMRRELLVQMAQEYYTCLDYGKSLTLLTHMLWDYRREKWWHLVSIIVKRALCCAYLSANVQDYVSLSIEALGQNVSINDKTRLLKNLLAVLNGQIPEPEPNLPDISLEGAVNQWKTELKKEPLCNIVDMSNLMSCIEAKARFSQKQYQVDSVVTIEMFVRITAPFPLQLERISVCVNNPRYSCEFAVCEKESTSLLLFEPGQARKFQCQFVPDPQDVGRDLQVTTISLQLGKTSERNFILQFNGFGGVSSGYHPEVFNRRSQEDLLPDFDSIETISRAQIIPRESKMSIMIEQASPTLLGEWFPISINLTNDEMTDAHDIQLSLNLLTSETNADSSIELCFDIAQDMPPLPLLLSINFLAVDSKFQKIFYVRSSKVLTAIVLMKITYTVNTETSNVSNSTTIMANTLNEGDKIGDRMKMTSFKEHSIKINVVQPFELSAKFSTLDFEPIENCYNKDPFLIQPNIQVLSPWPLIIEDTQLELTENFEKMGETQMSCLKNLILEENVIATEAICIRANTLTELPNLTLGSYTVHWRRKSSNLSSTFRTSTTLMAPSIYQGWLRIETMLPAHGWLYHPLPFTIHLYNISMCLKNIVLKMEASDKFMFSGHKQCTVSILPDNKKEFVFNLYPLVCGFVNLPKIKLLPLETVSTPTTPEQSANETTNMYLQDLVERCIPGQIYIMPQNTNSTSIEQELSSLKIGA